MKRQTVFGTMTAAGLFLGLCFSAQAAEPVTLHALMEDVPETKIIEAMLPAFEKQSGIKVEFDKVGYSDMHDKLVAQLSGSQSFYNLLEVDFIWAGEFAATKWLTDLGPFAKKTNYDLSPFIPSTLTLLGQSKEHLSLIPMYNYTTGLIYRTDLLNDAKLKTDFKAATGHELALPKSVEDYVEIAHFMKAHAGVTGAAMQGQRGDPISMEFLGYLFGAGGEYINASGKAALQSPEARKAAELFVGNMKNNAQEGVLSASLDDIMRLMCSGSSFSMITYWWMLPQVDDHAKCPAVAGKVALTVAPGGHGGSGGWGWGVPKNVTPEEQEAAWKFIQWVQSEDVSVARALHGHAPVRQDVYKNAEVLAKYPFYKEAEKVVATGKSFPVFTYSAQFDDLIGTQLSLAASGQAAIPDALKVSSEGLQRLLDK